MIRDLLIDLADDAPNYADADRVVGRYRRRRLAARSVATMSVATASVAAVVVLAVLAVGWWPAGRADRGGWGTAPGAPPALSDYPAVVSDAPGGAATSTGPVPGLVLMYRKRCQNGCAPPREVGVAPDGRRYAGEGLPMIAGIDSISPDGRWLVLQDNGAMELYDLAAGVLRPLSGLSAASWSPMAWSPESRYLWLWHPREGYRRLDLTSGAMVRYRPPGRTEVIAALPGGDVLVGPLGEHGGVPLPATLRRVDPAGGVERARIRVAADQLPQGEDVRNDPTRPALVNPAGTRMALTFEGRTGHRGLLDVDLATGQVLRRLDLPRVHARTQATDLDRYAAAGAYLTEGILVVTVAFDGRAESTLGLLDTGTGEIRELTRVPGAAELLVRGGDGWFGGD